MKAYYTIFGLRHEIHHGGIDAHKLAEMAVEEWWTNLCPDREYDEIEVTIEDDNTNWGTFLVRVYMSPTFEATKKG